MKAPLIIMIAFVSLILTSKVFAQTSHNKRNISAHGLAKMDSRTMNMSLKKIQDTAFQLSKKYLVVIIEVDKADTAYEKRIVGAVMKNIKLNRNSILSSECFNLQCFNIIF